MLTDELAHHGVLGMHWGVRKDRTASPSGYIAPLKTKYTIGKDGSVSIAKGSTVQRVVMKGSLVSKAGEDFNPNGVTYAAFTDKDKLTYADAFGMRKGGFVKQSSEVLTLTAKTALKSPGIAETTQMFFDSVKDNPQVITKMNNRFGTKQVAAALADPSTSAAYHMFGNVFDGGQYEKAFAGVNDNFKKKLTAKGFNMIVDPSDSTFLGIYEAPVAIFDGSKHLEVSSRYVVDKVSRQNVKALLKDNKARDNGEKFMESLGYA